MDEPSGAERSDARQTCDPSPGLIAAPARYQWSRILWKRRIAKRRSLSRIRTVLYGAIGIGSILTIWQFLQWSGLANPLLISSPIAVVKSFVNLIENGQLQEALASTATLFVIGFGVSVAIGLPCGVLLGWYRSINAAVDPLLSLAYALPRIALIPIVVAFLGPGYSAQVAIVVLLAVFPIIINVASGIATISENHLQVARSFLATDTDVLLTVALPGAVPPIISGIRQGMNMALAGVVVAEYFIGATGVGGMIFKAGLTLDTSQALVGAFVFAFSALILTIVLQLMENRFDRWRS